MVMKMPSSATPIRPLVSLLVMLVVMLVTSTATATATTDEVVGQQQKHSLRVGFYRNSCPSAETIVREAVTEAVAINPGIAACLVRLFFHDCFVRGCDASILIDSTSGKLSEKDHPANGATLRGIEVIDEAKAKLEALCPKTVSCADILAFAARDASKSVGGISYRVPGGRRDGTISLHSDIETNLPPPVADVQILKQAFMKKGMSVTEMVALSAAHSIGIAHCGSFADRLYSFNHTHPQDPSLSSKYASLLKKKCTNKLSNGHANLYFATPNRLDNHYYLGLKKNMGLLPSDQALATTSLTAHIVNRYINNATLWASDFAAAMLHLSTIDVLTGSVGQIRNKCSIVVS